MEKIKVIFVSYPASLLSIVGFLVYKAAGMIERCLILDHYIGSFESTPANPEIRHLFGRRFAEEVTNLAKNNKLLRRWLSYANFCENPRGRHQILKNNGTLSVYNLYQQKILEKILVGQDTQLSFLKGIKLLESLIEKGLDPYRMEMSSDPSGIERKKKIIIPKRATEGSRVFMTFPILKKDQEGKTSKTAGQEIIGNTTKILFENEVRFLEYNVIIIGVVGPANSGKSTFIASLYIEVNNILNSLATRNFPFLKAEIIDLDKSSPTLDFIFSKEIKRKCLHKKQWSFDVACQCYKEVKERIKYKKSNIFFLDLPGGKIDDVSLVLSGFCDGVIVVSRDWTSVTDEWRPLLKCAGTYEIAHFRSRTLDEIGPIGIPYTSIITTYKPRDLVSGRFVGLNRELSSYHDPIIRDIATILLFDLFPEIIRKKQILLQKALREV